MNKSSTLKQFSVLAIAGLFTALVGCGAEVGDPETSSPEAAEAADDGSGEIVLDEETGEKTGTSTSALSACSPVPRPFSFSSPSKVCGGCGIGRRVVITTTGMISSYPCGTGNTCCGKWVGTPRFINSCTYC